MRRLLLATLLALVAVAGLSALGPVSSSFSFTSKGVVASLTLQNPPEREILNTLDSGLRSEIRFNIRVYQESNGFFRFLGDRLVGESHPTYEARWDEFGDEYEVTADGRQVMQFRDAASFRRFFFSLVDYVTGIRLSPGRSYYALSNIEVDSTKIVPPLTMITVFFPVDRSTTPWERTSLHF